MISGGTVDEGEPASQQARELRLQQPVQRDAIATVEPATLRVIVPFGTTSSCVRGTGTSQT